MGSRDRDAAMLASTSIDEDGEASRLAAVARYEILDTPPDGAFDRITALAAQLFSTPIAIVSIVDEDRIWFKSHHGLDVAQIERAPGLCASAVLQPDLWVIENASLDPRSLSNPLVASEFGLRFYAGAPLRTRDGYGLGTLCLLDFAPRTFSDADAELLQSLAGIVVHELDVRLEARQAVHEIRVLKEREERLRKDAQDLAAEARRHADELEAVVGAVPDAVILADTQGRITLTNAPGAALLAGGHGIGDVLSQLTERHGESPSVAALLDAGATVLSDRTTGRAIEVRAYSQQHPDASAQVLESASTSVLILRDVTDEKTAHELKEALAEMMSHELRSPVTSIYAASQLLLRDVQPAVEDGREGLVADIAAEADRLRRLVDNILILAKHEGGEFGIEPEPVHLPHLLERLVATERVRWPDHRITLTIDENVPTLSGDATYIEQIVDNLISNAAKYSERDTTIAVVAVATDGVVELHVRDEGHGISDDERDRVFDLLFRAPRMAKTARGAGLGLFICRALARAMGGEVRLVASSERGSAFAVRLPIYPET